MGCDFLFTSVLLNQVNALSRVLGFVTCLWLVVQPLNLVYCKIFVSCGIPG